MDSGIYQITCLANGKFYIGSAVNVKRRWDRHRGELRKGVHPNAHLQNAWNKYGEHQFTWHVVESIAEKESLVSREQYYLDTLRPHDRTVGFNICPDAKTRLGTTMPPEAVEKCRIALTGRKVSAESLRKRKETRENRSPAQLAQASKNLSSAKLGHSTTEETRRKIGASHMGVRTYIDTDETRKNRREAQRRRRSTQVESEETKQKKRDSMKQYFIDKRNAVTENCG